ncbi:MAG: hypothetical protein M1151_07225 [Candidatus Thermoplasmatota archaeon]|jgi:hypothetical protein|nr:hypothetical protein [Candidatus Thermoplasmatota archaeon]MCL5786434.1 hypothetical protein [Candidatus Thermoplasmatota archaeon]
MDREILETWFAIVVEQNRLHRKWFDNLENLHKFKGKFRKYIPEALPEVVATRKTS